MNDRLQGGYLYLHKLESYKNKMPLKVFESMEAASAEIKEFQSRTNTKFVSCWTSKDFGHIQDVASSNHKVHFYETPETKKSIIIPYILMGNRWMACHRGKQLRLKSMQSRIRTKTIAYSHKIGCTAGIIMRDIMTFPNFKIKSDSKHFRREGSKALRSAIQEEKAVGVRKIIVQFPESKDHCAECISKAAGVATCVDERIVRQIQILKRQGMESVFEIQKKLREFVRKELYAGIKPPAPTDRQFFPTRVDIRNAMQAPGEHYDLNMDLEEPPDNAPVEHPQTYKVDTTETESSHQTVATDHQYGERIVPLDGMECMYVANEGVVAQVIIEEMVTDMDTQVASHQTVETSKAVPEVYHKHSNKFINQEASEFYHLPHAMNTPECHQPDHLAQQIPPQIHHASSQALYQSAESPHTYDVLGQSSQLTPQSYQVPLHSNHLPPQPYPNLPSQSNQISQQSYHLPMQNSLVASSQNCPLSAQSYPTSTEGQQVSTQNYQQSSQPYPVSVHIPQQLPQINPVSSLGNQVSLLGNRVSPGPMGQSMASSDSNQLLAWVRKSASIASVVNQVSSINHQVSSTLNQVSTVGTQGSVGTNQVSTESDETDVGTYRVSVDGHLVPIELVQTSTRPYSGTSDALPAGIKLSPTRNETSSKRIEALIDRSTTATSCIERLQELTSLTYKVQDNDMLRFMLDYLDSLTEEVKESLVPKIPRTSKNFKKQSRKSRKPAKLMKRNASVKGEIGTESHSQKKKSKTSRGNSYSQRRINTTSRLMRAAQLVITDKDAEDEPEEEEEEETADPITTTVRRSCRENKSKWSTRSRRKKSAKAIPDKTTYSRIVPSATETQTDETTYSRIVPSATQTQTDETTHFKVVPSANETQTAEATYSKIVPSANETQTAEATYSRIVPSASETQTDEATHSRIVPSASETQTAEATYSKIVPSATETQIQNTAIRTEPRSSENYKEVSSRKTLSNDMTVTVQTESPPNVDSLTTTSKDMQT